MRVWAAEEPTTGLRRLTTSLVVSPPSNVDRHIGADLDAGSFMSLTFSEHVVPPRDGVTGAAPIRTCDLARQGDALTPLWSDANVATTQ